VILSWLTGLVWQLPPADSWFGALAILGHAFVSAMLLIASYVFYVGRREGLLIQDRQAALSDPAIQRRDERGAD
jgi:hypothetical protein